MNDIAIRIENLSKRYEIGKEKDGSLRGTLSNLFKSGKSSTDVFWALKDVNIEIKRGDVVGIIGKNGAGKSTLLKILSQITQPSTGRIEINGRVASLLEVGTGFHPELTGRENIYLNGTILGMTRKEVRAKFDEIVAFSGVEKFIDTPVKHYSSGMYVRLAFSVAAHLEPEILIIDEVLAVGDAEFQRKCLGKMQDVADHGRTVLFVSHNLSALNSICNKGIVMNKGQVKFIGDIKPAIDHYLNDSAITFNQVCDLVNMERSRGAQKIKFSSLAFNTETFFPDSSFEAQLNLSQQDQAFEPDYVNFGFHIVDQFENQVYHLSNLFTNQGRAAFSESNTYHFSLERLGLKPGVYFIWLWLEANGEEQDFINSGIKLEVLSGNVYQFSNSDMISGIVQPNYNFYIRHHEMHRL